MQIIKKDMTKVIIIAGPTASGKTALSIELAKKINGEIISCDSMQIYKDMNIGSAKPTKEEMAGIKHYMIDIVTPNERYSVAEYKREAERCIEKILKENKTPIIVGGTGLYINSLLYGIDYLDISFDEKYREQIMLKANTKEGLEKLYKNAQEIDPEAMKKISINDKKRITRVLEIYHSTGKNKTEIEATSRANGTKFNYLIYGIKIDREILYEKINKRVDTMLKNGLIEEVKKLKNKYPDFKTAKQAIGYKEIIQYFRGEYTKEEAIEKIKQETRRYAKRQMTWLRKIKEIKWLEGNDMQNNLKIILEDLN